MNSNRQGDSTRYNFSYVCDNIDMHMGMAGDELTSDNMIEQFAMFLMAAGYHPESIAASCQTYANEHLEEDDDEDILYSLTDKGRASLAEHGIDEHIDLPE